MKKVTIESVTYEILMYTIRFNNIKKIKFTFKIDSKNYDVILDNLDKERLFFSIPFTHRSYDVPCFKKKTQEEQIFEIDFLCRGFTNYSFNVTDYRDYIFRESLEKSILNHIKKKESSQHINYIFLQSDFQYMNFKNDYEKEDFMRNIINYYRHKERREKLKKLSLIA